MSRLSELPLPVPPDALRVGPFREGSFRSRLHDEAVAARLGRVLGILFATCFLTGLFSHLVQHPPSWFAYPSRPVDLYRWTQGLHVLTGLASVPVLLAKLFTVYPRFFAWPPAKDVGNAVERGSLLLLVGGSVSMLVTGVMNIAGWYAFGFFFTVVHYWSAWITIGALLVHIGAKLAAARRGLATPLGADDGAHGLSRRGFLGVTGAASGAVVLATAGQTVPALRDVSVLSPRRPDRGPQGLPVNTTAAMAGTTVVGADYRLVVEGPRRLELTLADLEALPQVSHEIAIACVEGWSASAVWTGVRLADLLDLAGVSGRPPVRVDSLQRGGPYRSSVVPTTHVRDPQSLLALRLDGRRLHPDHGYPLRLITPSRPGVLQTKWVGRVVVL